MPVFSLRTTLWRWLILGHRWLGIATCLLFVMWFATGFVMMYVGFPEYTRAERLSRLESIDWDGVRVSPEAALRTAGASEFPEDFRLEMLAGEPVYRAFVNPLVRRTLSATTGEALESIDVQRARSIAERASSARASAIATIERDQWTVAGTFDRHRPLHRVELQTPDGLELYVSSLTGEIVLDTTRRERGWNWLGAVLHWLYFTELRANQPLWSQVVMWISGVGIVVAVTGLWLGIDRLRIRRRQNNGSITPFRGWMAWHHVLGVIGGLFVLTWIFSGWLSMSPRMPWEREFDASRPVKAAAALADNIEPTFPMDVEILRRHAGDDIREVAFMWALGKPQAVLAESGNQTRVIDSASGLPRVFSERELTARAPQLMRDAKLESVERLDTEDAYWYSRNNTRSLPILRFKFDDGDRTWIHVDLTTGQLVGWLRNSDRIQRWLFNGLHSFDLQWLRMHRPLWDVLMWVLGLIGLTLCATSVVIGWRAIWR